MNPLSHLRVIFQEDKLRQGEVSQLPLVRPVGGAGGLGIPACLIETWNSFLTMALYHVPLGKSFSLLGVLFCFFPFKEVLEEIHCTCWE